MAVAAIGLEADPYGAELVRRSHARAPLALLVFAGCVIISTVFEVLRFPDRSGWMLAFAAGFAVLAVGTWLLLQRWPGSTIGIAIVFVNVVGVALNAYHVIVGASLAMCVWTLTGLLGASAVIIPWGPRSQLLASLGALVSYPLHLEFGTVDPLTWGAGGAYLLVVVGLGAFGASLFAEYARSDLRLTAALFEREARLQSYFDLSPVGTAIVARGDSLTEVNDELCRILGVTHAELLGTAWKALVDAASRWEIGALLERAFAGGANREQIEAGWFRGDGTTVHTVVSARGLPAAGSVIDQVLVLVHDVTARKVAELEREQYLGRAEEARREAEAASRAKDAFLAMVSHELRTPLTPIMAWARLLRDPRLAPEKTSGALAVIERNARLQARLIDDLLEFSRAESGSWRLALHPLDLRPVVHAALEVVEPTADSKGLRIEAVLDEGPIAVNGDARRLQQVVWNLLSNAVKFTPRGGRIRVRVERDGDHARIAVRDTGQGIEATFLPHVFEPFRQASDGQARTHAGLGLGLSIVRALVEMHGGRIRAESDGDGQGAAFVVELPLLTDAASVAAVQSMPATREVMPSTGVPLNGLHVLVVDDDPDSIEAVRALLAGCGAEVRTAVSALQAFEIASDWSPDVLVSDVAMPGEDGYALIRKVRALHTRLASVPAIALTAYAGADDRERLLEAGFDVHLAKPFDPAVLPAMVRKMAHAAGSPLN